MSKVLLTGVTGFLGSHTTIQLLNKGYSVLGTLRNINRAEEIKSVIGQHTKHIDKLTFAEADLSNKAAWSPLMKGIEYVQHIASPIPRNLPKDEAEIINPAVNGTLAVLEAAAQNGVKRVILTSSSGAIIYGKAKDKRSGIYSEDDWSNPDNKKDNTPYFRSKAMAERAAWDFIEKDQSGMSLTTICPGAILGPVLEKDFGTSANIVIKSMDVSMPAVPKIGFDMVDVRSVAELHILAMEKTEAAGQRFVGSSGFLSFAEVTGILKEAYPDRKIPKGTLPSFLVRLISNFDKTLKPILIDLDVERKVDNSKAVELLGWQPIPVKEAVLACARSIIEQGLVK